MKLNWASDCQKTYPAESFGGKNSVKGNRQGSLSRSITRRSDQNCKIILQTLILQFCSQLVKKVLLDFFDKLAPPQTKSAGEHCLQPFAEEFFVGARRFFAALLCVTQGKTPQLRRKRLGEGAMLSYEDAAKRKCRFFILLLRPRVRR